MSRERTASPCWDKRDHYWYCRPWIGGVRQKRIRASELREADHARAVRWASVVQKYCDTHGCVPGERDLTFGEYVTAYLKTRTDARSHRSMSGLFDHHAVPRLGALPMRAINRETLLDFVHALDEDVRSGKYGAKTAENIWY